MTQGLEARSDLDFPAALADRAWVILRHLEHRGAVREALARLAAAIRRLRLQDPGSGLELSLELDSGERGRELEADLVDLFEALLSACEGYPYFIQVYGHAAWQVSTPRRSALRTRDATEALRLGGRELDVDLYAGSLGAGERGARKYMREMAALGDGSVSSGAVARAFGGHRPASPTRDRLIDDGLVYSPARGQVAFTVPASPTRSGVRRPEPLCA